MNQGYLLRKLSFLYRFLTFRAEKYTIREDLGLHLFNWLYLKCEVKYMKREHGVVSNSLWVLKSVWKYSHLIIYMMVLEIIVGVVAPLALQVFPATIVRVAQYATSLQDLLKGILVAFLIMSVAQVGSVGLQRRNWLQYIAPRLVAGWPSLMKKTQENDFEYFESEEGQRDLDKAGNAVGGNHFGYEGTLHTLVALGTNVIGLVVYLCILSTINIYILLLLIGLSLISFVLFFIYDAKGKAMKDEISENNLHVMYYSRLAMNVPAGKDIRAYSLENVVNSLFKEKDDEAKRLRNKQHGYYNVYNISIVVINMARDLICYLYLIHKLINEGMNVADFVLYLAIVSGISNWLITIGDSVVTLVRCSTMVDDLRYYLDKDDTYEVGDVLDHVPFDVVFDHVSFNYAGSDKEILSDFCLHIHPKEALAIVGLNGAGKTTLVRLMAGLYHPKSGHIYINGKDIETLARKDYFKHIGAIFQNAYVFEYTFGEIVSGLCEGEYDDDKVIECLKQSGLYTHIETLPQSIHTYYGNSVGLDGVSLSGGQVQKLLLAQMLYKDADLLLLDEPTAALDALSEHEVYENYHEVCHDRTSVFISHRLASTRFCDRIIYLENGKIVEEGTHEELMNKRGAYYDLFELQSKYYREGGEAHEEFAEC